MTQLCRESIKPILANFTKLKAGEAHPGLLLTKGMVDFPEGSKVGEIKADRIREICEIPPSDIYQAAFTRWQWGFAVAGLLLFIGGSWWVYVQRREYFFVHISSKNKIRPHKVLVMPISPLKELEQLRVIENGYVFFDKNLESTLMDLTGQSLPNFPWQQTMRGIKAHQPELERVYLVGSKEGSFVQLEDCKKFIKHYLPDLEIECWAEEVDFENLEELLDELDETIKHARRNFQTSDIMLDVTPGQKTISIAAALVTLNRRELEFQYVSTTPPHRVIAFNTNAEKSEIGT